MASVTVHGLTKADQDLAERAKRIANLLPAMKEGAELINKEIANAFRDARTVDGNKWPTLATSTKKSRSTAQKSSRKRTKGGKLTKGARRTRLLTFLTAKPLQDSGRLANEAKSARAVGKRTIRWGMAAEYAGVHLLGYSGSQSVPTRFQKSKKGKLYAVQGHERNMNIPQRNYSVFTFAGGSAALMPAVKKKLVSIISKYIEGKK